MRLKASHPNNSNLSSHRSPRPAESSSKRFVLGSAVFVVGFLSPALIPVVLSSGLPSAWKTALSGGLAFGIPELAAVVAVAIMGREGFQDLKRFLWGLFRKAAPPARVSRMRYRIGLVMFTLPILFAWLGPYADQVISPRRVQVLPVLMIGDIAFLSSFFVLGGDFWCKVRALFIWESRPICPTEPKQ
jgi:hypothetical protein